MIAGSVEAAGKQYTGTYVCMGNPHFVIFVDDITRVDLPTEGRALETSPLFPERCNIEFAQVLSDGNIRMRVWERGSGITMACGTGACATAVAAALNKKATRASNIVMDGGTLHIEWNEQDNHIYMTGPAARVFEGEIEL
jgi:diaminopimelate epimerase